MKKNRNKPELKDLKLNKTEEQYCYCEEGEVLAVSVREKKHKGVHYHKLENPCSDQLVVKAVSAIAESKYGNQYQHSLKILLD